MAKSYSPDGSIVPTDQPVRQAGLWIPEWLKRNKDTRYNNQKITKFQYPNSCHPTVAEASPRLVRLGRKSLSIAPNHRFVCLPSPTV